MLTMVGRVVGNQKEGGLRTNGIYYPPTADKSGCFIMKLACGDDGIFRIENYNGKNASPGKGQADTLAKWASTGSLIKIGVNMRQVEADYRNPADGYSVVVHNGNVLKTTDIIFTAIPGTLTLGLSGESDKQIASEIAAFDPANPGVDIFFRRPAGWMKEEGHPDRLIWNNILAARKAAVFVPGEKTFGHASVWYGANTAAPPASSPAPVASVNGITLEMLLKNNWKLEQVAASKEYSALVPADILKAMGINTAPPVPAAPVIPAAPGETAIYA